MDEFEKILERAKNRQKELGELYSTVGDVSPRPLKEANQLLNKFENTINFAKSQPNLNSASSINTKKQISSDSCINTKSLHASNFKENLSDTNLSRSSRTLVSSESSPRTPTKTLNIQKENFNMEIKLTSLDNIRVEVEVQERDDSDFEMEETEVEGICKIIPKNNKNKTEKDVDSDKEDDKPVIRPDAKKRLQRLGKLYAEGDEADISSPIHRTEDKFVTDTEDDKPETHKAPAGCGLARLKALADTRNQWEDEIATPQTKKVAKNETPKKSWKAPAPKPPVQTTTMSKKYPAPKPPTDAHAFTRVPSRENSPLKLNKSPQKTPASNSSHNSKDRPVSATKQLAWDQAVIETLESQGFTRTNSNARLVYNYKEGEKSSEKKTTSNEDIAEEQEEIEELPVPKPVSKLTSKIKEVEEKVEKEKPQYKSRSPTKDISNKVAMFESPSKKDPALLSVSERKALFEKNKGNALIPKAAFGMAAPVIKKDKNEQESNPVSVKQNAKPALSTKPTVQSKPSTPTKSTKAEAVDSPATAHFKQSGGIASKMKALLEKKSTISQNQIASGVKKQKEKDMNLLLNRFNKQKEVEEEIEVESETDSDSDDVSETTKMIGIKTPKIIRGSKEELSPPPPPMPPVVKSAAKRRSKGDSPKVREVLEDVKRIRVSPAKAGRMYPNLSDIEAVTETEQEQSDNTPESSFEENSSYADSEGPNTSFGRDILQAVCKNQTPQKRPIFDEDTASDISSLLEDMDEFLDEALAEDSENGTDGPTPPKHGKQTPPRNTAAPSKSFNYKQFSPEKKLPNKFMSPLKEARESIGSREPPTVVVDGDNILPLTHTVSFYRKQQAQGSRTPVRQISRQPAVEEESPEKINDDAERLEVQNKIQELLESVSKQQTVISQASQALNLCMSTVEFFGSSEQVEAERLLLLATQRRQAALHEVQRLRVEGALHPGGTPCAEKGTLTISDISFPLKKEYARALAAAGGLGHHVVCLVRFAEQVVPTRLASTQASPRDNLELKIRIPGTVVLDDVYSDFTATLEVYTLQAQEEVLPHEVKYHIAPKKGGSKLTPRKLKQDSKLVMPAIQSPAGPQAVRTPSFALMGYVVFSLQGISRTQWTLNNTPAMSLLEGSIHMKIKCELSVSVEHRGFLSMFDDVSGFGAWHRRWCLLKGNSICYWKYPDDEKKKAPIDSINLQSCSTRNVAQVSREICARPHTFLLETVRAARSTDIDSLVTVCQGNKTIIRHLLSADTKEERIQWCEELNRALRAIRITAR